MDLRAALRRRPRTWLWSGWALVQTLMGLLTWANPNPINELTYYFYGMHPELPPPEGSTLAEALARATATGTTAPVPLAEYPHAGTWFLCLIDALLPTDFTLFRVGFFAGMILLSAGLFAYLLRVSRPRGEYSGPLFWLGFSLCSGALLLTRLDLIPGLIVAFAAAALFRHAGAASGLLAWATLVKLWPGVLAAALVGRWNQRGTWVRLASFGGALVALAGVTVAGGGMERLLSPLSYQGVRGLQIEAVAATPFILAGALSGGSAADNPWRIHFAPSKSFEVTGPGVELGILASNAVMLGTLLAVVTLALLLFLHPRLRWTPELAVLVFLATIVLLIIGNKVFSPQYLTWLGPLVAVALCRLPEHRGVLGRVAVILVLLAAVTTVIFPFTYDSLHQGPELGVSLVLVARNVLMLPLAWLLCATCVRQLRAQLRS